MCSLPYSWHFPQEEKERKKRFIAILFLPPVDTAVPSRGLEQILWDLKPLASSHQEQQYQVSVRVAYLGSSLQTALVLLDSFLPDSPFLTPFAAADEITQRQDYLKGVTLIFCCTNTFERNPWHPVGVCGLTKQTSSKQHQSQGFKTKLLNRHHKHCGMMMYSGISGNILMEDKGVSTKVIYDKHTVVLGLWIVCRFFF